MGKVKRAFWRNYFSIVKGYSNFNYEKQLIIDYLFDNFGKQNSFLDLGGIWRVDGAYSKYILDQYPECRGNMIDYQIPEVSSIKSSKYKGRMSLIDGHFCDEDHLGKIDSVDFILMFDILLHQVEPNWSDVLKLYADKTTFFVIYNQQWVASKNTIRLLDLGKDDYFLNVPHESSHPTYQRVFDSPDELHPTHNKPLRDIPDIWQWGITDNDLLKQMNDMGFEQVYYKDFGQYGNLKNFSDHGFIFKKCN